MSGRCAAVAEVRMTASTGRIARAHAAGATPRVERRASLSESSRGLRLLRCSYHGLLIDGVPKFEPTQHNEVGEKPGHLGTVAASTAD